MKAESGEYVIYEFSKEVHDFVPFRYAEKVKLSSLQVEPSLRLAREKIPTVGIYHAFYNGDHVLFQVHDGGFRVINYHGEKDDAPKLNVIKWIDETPVKEAEKNLEPGNSNSGLKPVVDEVKLLFKC